MNGKTAYETWRAAVPEIVCNAPAGKWEDLPEPIRAGFDAIAAQESQPAPDFAALDALEKVVSSHERVMYAAAIDIRHGRPGTARRLLGEALDGWDGPQWDGTETGAEYLERTREGS